MKLTDLIFPKNLYCVSCGRPLPLQEEGAAALCDFCAAEMTWIEGRCCLRCGRQLSDENPHTLCRDCGAGEDRPFTKGSACALYSGRAAELVRDMKYREKAWYADTISAFMAEKYFSSADPETGELPHYDCVIGVPMSEKKKASRGYDQAALIAKGLSLRIGVPYLPGALTRVRETNVMSGLSAEERGQNLANAFSIGCDKIESIAAKKILLADDVYTTGSSVSACAGALLAAGAARVDVIVFAIGADARRAEGRPAVVESPGQLRAKGPT